MRFELARIGTILTPSVMDLLDHWLLAVRVQPFLLLETVNTGTYFLHGLQTKDDQQSGITAPTVI